MGKLALSEVTSDADFTPLFVAFRDGFTNPGNALWALFMGDWQPHSSSARAAALEEATARLLSWHRADPTSTWLKVVDEDSGAIVAGGRWSIYEKGKGNPYDGHGAIETAWFPEGDARNVATKLLNDFLATAGKHANRPHAFLNILFTVPEARRKGAASQILEWGISKADEQGLEVFIEATKEGRPLYEKYGCKVIDENHFDLNESDLPPTKDPEVRDAVVKELMPFTWWSMLRPAKA